MYHNVCVRIATAYNIENPTAMNTYVYMKVQGVTTVHLVVVAICIIYIMYIHIDIRILMLTELKLDRQLYNTISYTHLISV